MNQSNILCPGISTILDDKTGKPIVHYLQNISDNGRLFCVQSGCKYAYYDENGEDVWVSDYIPATIPKPE